ncbi:MAG: HAD-IC family P-type ATPase, partial [Acidobacteria bacterium]|nr:HAD-IC family P-type ATPase [Acidobacteriota bacterium]
MLRAAPERDSGSRCAHCSLPIPGSDDHQQGLASFCCFGCRFAHQIALPGLEAENEGSPPSTLLLRLGLGIFLAMNIMAINGVFYSRELFGAAAQAGAAYSSLTELFAYLAFFLATAVLALLGIPLLGALLRPLSDAGGREKGRWRVGTGHLILLGAFSAYALSAYNTFRGSGSLYFDTAAMVLVAVTVGSFLEGRAKLRAARSATQLHHGLPDSVLIRSAGSVTETRLEDLEVGDQVRVLPGETIPVDGWVVEGASRVNESSFTGEARSRTVEAGSRLLAGTANLEGQLWVRTERVGVDTVLSQTERSLEEARARQPSIQRLADRVAGVFAPAVVVLALGVFSWQAAGSHPDEGLLRGLAVLLISCPCALGLAAPLASWNALKRAATLGILIDSSVTLERAAVVDRLFFDKTGTLTEPELDLSGVATAPGVEPDQALQWAARLEAASPHPIARAFLRKAPGAEHDRRTSALVPASESRVVPGRGVEGRVTEEPLVSGAQPGPDVLRLRLGSAAWVRESGLSDDSLGSPPGAHTLHSDASPRTGPGWEATPIGEDSAGTVYLFSEDRILA